MRAVFWAWRALPLLCALGCGEADFDASERGKLAVLISEVADAATRDQSLQELFAPGAKPDKAERRQFARFSYRLVSDPVVEGDQATIRVLVRHARNDAEAGEMDWTAVREGEGWKLQSAPLPAGKTTK